MRSIIILCWICIFHCEGFSINIAEDIIFLKGDSLFKKEQYQEAGIEYDRVAYSSTENNIRVNALMRKADCYLMRSDYSGAQKCLLRVTYYDLNDSLQFSARYKTAFAAYLNSNFELAESQMEQIKIFVEDSTLVLSSHPLYALILNENNKWEKAKSVLLQFIELSTDMNSLQKQELFLKLNELYASKKIPKMKDVEKAKRLSTFLPGTGQLYAGYLGEGIISVFFQAAGIGFTGLCIWKQYYVTGALIGFSFFQKFYAGGINRTEYLTLKKNYLVKRKFNDTAKQTILEWAEIKKTP